MDIFVCGPAWGTANGNDQIMVLHLPSQGILPVLFKMICTIGRCSEVPIFKIVLIPLLHFHEGTVWGCEGDQVH
jgi:hypothetical protein